MGKVKKLTQTCARLLAPVPLSLALLLFFYAKTFAAAPNDGQWDVVGSLIYHYGLNSAGTLLQDGRVLVAEGMVSNSSSPLSSQVELYDPTTKTWSQTGSLLQARHTDVPNIQTLQNGKVLVEGGETEAGSIVAAELYDPATGTWSQTGSMNAVHSDGASIVLNDGRVLVAGGHAYGGGDVLSSETYDPAIGSWSYAGNLSTARNQAGIVKLQDGRVLVAGGTSVSSGYNTYYSNTAEIFDPTTNTWSSAGTLPYAFGGDMTLLPDGRVFEAGGSNGSGCIANSAIYDPTTNSWTATASMPQPRCATGILLDNGNIMVFGGSDNVSTVASSVVYNPATNTWTNGPSLNGSRGAYLTIPLANGNVLIAEGSDGSNYLSSAKVYTTAPIVSISNSNATLNEGDTYSTSGSFTDDTPNATSWTATVDYGDGSGTQSLTLSGTNFSLSHQYKDNGTYTITVKVTNNFGDYGTGTTSATVHNVAPLVGTITAPSSPTLVNTAITASASFTDPGVLDTHTASWNWGDGNATTGTLTESNGSGSVSNSHTYTATGVYTITLTVTDKDGGAGTSTFQYVAVYDSNTSFAGGRSYDNPASASPSTSGKVSFGISSKYSNSNTLIGSVKWSFKAANIDFASTSLQSLATSNGKAYLTGSGTLNGSGTYTFLATGIDGSVVGGNDLIRFQIKDASGNVVYDSQPGASDTTDPTTQVATDNIRVH